MTCISPLRRLRQAGVQTFPSFTVTSAYAGTTVAARTASAAAVISFMPHQLPPKKCSAAHRRHWGYSHQMINQAQFTMAATSTGPLWLIVAGVVVVAGLLAAFLIGSRRTARRQISTAVPHPTQTAAPAADPARRGEGWQTPEDDPEQGHPHR